MKQIVFIAVLVVGCGSYANTNNFKIMLDQYTLAQSQEGLNDTIEVTKSAWTSSDSLHLTAYICGGTQIGMMCEFIARDNQNLLFKETYENNRMAYHFSFATSRINPNSVKLVAMTIGAAKTENKMGWKYRMGILKFI